MTGLVTYSLVGSYLVHEHTVSGYILTGDFIRHFESKELWEKLSCYVIHCVRSLFQFVGKPAVSDLGEKGCMTTLITAAKETSIPSS